jgi:hypothetical protein
VTMMEARASILCATKYITAGVYGNSRQREEERGVQYRIAGHDDSCLYSTDTYWNMEPTKEMEHGAELRFTLFVQGLS